ncbi:hypothetical protein V7938_002874 [Proteus mirabilis]
MVTTIITTPITAMVSVGDKRKQKIAKYSVAKAMIELPIIIFVFKYSIGPLFVQVFYKNMFIMVGSINEKQ